VTALPCAGLHVVELALGTSELGLGMAGGVPGMVLADLGAKVTRVIDPVGIAIDRDVVWGRAWHRDKQLVATDDVEQIRALLAAADVALVYGDETRIEQRGFGYAEIARAHPSLVYARVRPSRTGCGVVPDYGLLVEAHAGFCSQLQGHRPGPIFVDVRAPGAGTTFILLSSVLALLRRRALTQQGGWTETSLYDGMLATLGTMIGRAEHAPDHVESYWENGSTFPNFMYRCQDDELIQVWFGGKGMYEKVIQVLGDEPSTAGYYAEQVSGQLQVRAQRWRELFTAQPASVWMERLRAVGVACEPVLAPGEALKDPHLTAAGIALERGAEVLVSGGISLERGAEVLVSGAISVERGPAAVEPAASGGALLAGVRVLDFSAFVAGPLSAQVLADLGAEVIKVEPPEGEAMRAAAYAIAACQRGKRSLAIDITSAAARPVVERLIAWADVVLHNFRVGVSARLGIDEATVLRINPRAVYLHSSAFGAQGPRAKMPGNDALMQALTGFEHAVGGSDNAPLAATWIPIDMAGGWVGAIGVLAGLYARATQARGQVVNTSLLGAGMLLQSGTYLRDGKVVRQPELDRDQTGYGAGYRIYECADGRWLAVVIADVEVWQRVASLPECGELPREYVPLRRGPDDEQAQRAEAVLQAALRGASCETWRERLSSVGALAEPVEHIDRDQFRRKILDDPFNQQLGRVVSYDVRAWGRFEQLGCLMRCGPSSSCQLQATLPDVGEHSVAILGELGFDEAEISALIAGQVVRQL
jgi:crotonobetainyl-CoA:carnitine CoA-transferase CaiB-like acyl-CoA transferase